MNLAERLRFVGGYVTFRADGGFPERFLNVCAHRRVELWNTKRDGIALYACCAARDYARLRHVARKTGVRMRLVEKRGLPFITRRFRHRFGLSVGAAASVALLYLLSGHIWVVDVQGNDRVDTASIEQAVAECGVRAGGMLSAVDIPTIQLKTLNLLPDLSWLTVNLEGSTAHVMVSERKDPDENRAPRQPANVKAAIDGVIVSMEVYEGDALVQTGDAVTEGMLLVSGVRTTEVGDYLTRARANVFARTTRILTVSVPLKEEKALPTGKTISRPTWYLFGIEIPWYNSGALSPHYTVERRNHLLTVNGRQLPIGWYTDYATEHAPAMVTYTEQQAEKMAWKQMSALEKELQSTATIHSRRETSERVGDTWHVTVECECIENIAVQEDILLFETEKKG